MYDAQRLSTVYHPNQYYHFANLFITMLSKGFKSIVMLQWGVSLSNKAKYDHNAIVRQ